MLSHRRPQGPRAQPSDEGRPYQKLVERLAEQAGMEVPGAEPAEHNRAEDAQKSDNRSTTREDCRITATRWPAGWPKTYLHLNFKLIGA